MHLIQKFIFRVLAVFSPTIVFHIFDLNHETAGTAVALIQGLVLFPFIVWMWVDFRRNPDKYPAPAWLITFFDIFFLGFIVFSLGYVIWYRNI